MLYQAAKMVASDPSIVDQNAYTLNQYRLEDLKAFCAQRNLPTDGRKVDLIKKLVAWKHQKQAAQAVRPRAKLTPIIDLRRNKVSDVGAANQAHAAAQKLRQQQLADKKSSDRDNGSLYVSSMLLDDDSQSTGEIPYEALKRGAELGSGGFKICYAGVYNNIPVAIGELRVTNFRENDLVEMRHEIGVLKQLRHDNIVRFIGVCHNERHLCIVTELCENGDLYEYMKRVKAPAFSQQLSMMHDIAHGVAYLHSRRPNIVHRDLKSQNILVASNLRAKINDFGLARIVPKANTALHTQCGTPNWQAPEMWQSNPSYTEKVDVYACGLIFWEILQWAHEPYPYYNMDEHQLYEQVRDHGVRPDLTKLLRRYPSNLLMLIQDMWHADPLLRPSMNVVLDRLNEYF